MVKNLPASAGDARDAGSIPGSGTSPGRGNGNPLQYSFLPGKFQVRIFLEWTEEPDRLHGVAKSWTRLSTYTHMIRIPAKLCLLQSTSQNPLEEEILSSPFYR